MTIKEVSVKWGISVRRVNTYCNEGRITGAKKNGSIWLIPTEARKPEKKTKVKRQKRISNSLNNLEILQNEYEKEIEVSTKKENGIYYTPYELVNLIFEKINIPKNSIILDPCCGMGSFLVGAYNRGYQNIFGIDKDENAIKNIKRFSPDLNVKCFDSINNSAEDTLKIFGLDKVDLIIGNPPYVAHGSIFGNLFVGSIIRSLDMLKSDGILSYIIPKNFLHIATYKELRKKIISEFQILSIIDIGSFFKGVRGEQIILTLKNSAPTKSSEIQFHRLKGNTLTDAVSIIQSHFTDEIRIYNSEIDRKIYDYINEKFVKLGDLDGWKIARGRAKKSGSISGKEIRKFGFKSRVQPEDGHKIFIQNIYSTESGIIAAFGGNLEASETITVIENGKKDTCIYLLGLLHSRFINFVLVNYCFNNSRLTVHADNKYLSKLPFMMPNNTLFKQVIELVVELQEKPYMENEWFESLEKLNKVVYKIYDLAQEDIEYIEEFMKNVQSTRWFIK